MDELQQPKKRNGLIFAAGLVSIILSSFTLISGIMYAALTTMIVDILVEIYVDLGMPIAVDELYLIQQVFFFVGIAAAAAGALGVVLGAILIKKYARITDGNELRAVQGGYIAITVFLFLCAGIVPLVLSLIALNADKNKPATTSVGTTGGLSNTEEAITIEINKLKDMRKSGVISETEYSKLVVSLLSEKR